MRGIDLDVAHEEFVVLVGPSGCGKSTILRMIAGLEEASGGEIRIGDRLVNNTAPKDRNIAMVFQNYALYPHKTVYGNMAFALRAQRLPKADVERRVQQAAAVLGLEDLMERKPGELSGGQRQRVAMGRAIVRDPAVFLFDEPLSNLDAELRTRLRSEIKKLHQKLRATVVYVTHDQVEAMTLADRIVILNKGKVEQVGSPTEVYAAPVNLFVAGFIGSPAMNMIPAEIAADTKGRPCIVAAGVSLPLDPRNDIASMPGMKATLRHPARGYRGAAAGRTGASRGRGARHDGRAAGRGVPALLRSERTRDHGEDRGPGAAESRGKPALRLQHGPCPCLRRGHGTIAAALTPRRETCPGLTPPASP